MADGVGDRFRVAHHSDVRSCWRRWRTQAAQVGLLGEFLAALRQVEWRLTHEPVDWGEPFHNLHGLHMIQRRAVEWFFLLTYAVNEEERFVYLQNVQLLPNNPLE
jgi:hypothetical protein